VPEGREDGESFAALIEPLGELRLTDGKMINFRFPGSYTSVFTPRILKSFGGICEAKDSISW
jgi:hypothetical protein